MDVIEQPLDIKLQNPVISPAAIPCHTNRIFKLLQKCLTLQRHSVSTQS